MYNKVVGVSNNDDYWQVMNAGGMTYDTVDQTANVMEIQRDGDCSGYRPGSYFAMVA